ncbi:TonB-dependent receptor domain-containing protein [Aliikangiella coralliicola]|uniref:TonB-dependent receptor n=1 Tax=Aliikangiella coralliicola TaxID=2592383 RepID=A0A545UJ06_9GAMM|nr:TonB-dependent receptor [Aliikangiella coralliicola]TQV89447.1 TonB-dependent receptor [Aliikangiella coralliicola]
MNSIFKRRAIVVAVSLAITISGNVLGSESELEKEKAENRKTSTENSTVEAISADASEKANSESENNESDNIGEEDGISKTEEKENKVVITGSRLRRDSFSVATPLVTMDKEAISDTGLGLLSEILVDGVPAISEGSSNTNTQSSVQNTGLSTVNLRDLGVDRTLTLIDGRRVVSNSYSGNYVSLSSIPSGMVDRIEIISGGASAVYGSDAIAGVVNIITQKDKEGFEFQVRGGHTPAGGGREFSVDFDYGNLFNNGKTYFFVGTSWDRQFGVSWEDRDRAALEADYRYDDELFCNQMATETGDQCMRDITPADWRARSDGTAGGVFEEGRGGVGGYYYTEEGLQTGWLEERDGVNSAQWVQLKIPNDRFSTAFKLTHEFEDVSSYFQTQYAQTDSLNRKSPEDDYESAYVLTLDPVTGAPGRIRPGTISINNPFAPAEIANNAGSSISWDRRFHEVGQIMTDNTRKTLRTWAGLQGDMFDGAWDWDASIGYGKFQQKQKRLNELNIFRVAEALDSEYAADGVTIQCADADARARGCVPLNIFGVGSITPEMADWIRANPTITTDISQFTALGYITGDLFEMPAGNVSAVFGAEYRRDRQGVVTSEGHRNGGITFNVVPTFDGEIDVWETFAEFGVPLVRDASFAKNLSAEFSVRMADYSPKGIGTVGSHKVGLVWEPVEGYLLRANYARAQRAPNITELLSPARGDFDGFSDICDGVTETSTGAGHDNCRLEPSIAAVIAGGGTFEDDNNGYSPNAGNENLKEETADTFTFGFTMAPDFLEDFKIAVDYYDIEIRDAIDQVSNADILRQCYDSSLPFGDSNSFCNDITRDTDGNIIEILQRVINLSETRARGYDLALEYKHDLGDYGRLKFRADTTHVIEHSNTFEGNDGLETVQLKGELASGIFEDRASASLSWYKSGWRVRWSTRYLGSIVDSHERVDEFEELIAENNQACANGDASCVTNPETPFYLYFPSYTKHNLSVSYTMDIGRDSELRIYGGANNVFDDLGPFIPRYGQTAGGGAGNSDSEYGGGIGRLVYVGAEFKF